ncbi:uncharacterized protein [Onthophagus taurus]|uniref:uncharacterized protein n=1 Tax=Onthophagus taurus TaxID=166361 RepID=UPI0039BE54C0
MGYGGWARTFIADVRVWQKEGPETDYYATQAIVGHGSFGTYLKQIRRRENDECWFGCEVPDTPAHTIFECPKFDEVRRQAKDKVGKEVTEGNVEEMLVRSEDSGLAVMEMLREIMKIKERDEYKWEATREGGHNPPSSG